ncbi:2-isopropylmalate synthase [Buchnera aphidicola (Tetraneura ulmi)]|uniref:2-isopropylmalate synthase n=1 Tax=Buchnera aphidicola TaxID=9 RepID=UPI0034644747
MKEKIIIFDTTLRDGEQSLKSSLTVQEKIKIAFSLEQMGIDVIEVGFPISSPGDFKSTEVIAANIKNSTICSLARCVEKDIEAAALAMSKSSNFRIHLFLGTSSLHIKSKLKRSFSEIIDLAVFSIKKAKKYTDNIEFSCEDAGRTEIDNLCKIVELAIKAGANTINIPDTVGYTIPNEFSKIITSLYNRVPNIESAIISVHCHNDLGMAVGNSISAIQSGARQIEGTINGLGERAGNTALEEIIMAIKIRSDILNVFTNINCEEIYKTSKIVSNICKVPIPFNKSIVGSNVYSHSSGVHQDGVLKNRNNYEIISPETVGMKPVQLNLTSRSGRAAVKHRMEKLGYLEKEYDLNKLYANFLILADKKGRIFDHDLEALVFMDIKKIKYTYFQLDSFDVTSGSDGVSVASVTLFCGKEKKTSITKTRNGIIAAVYKTINRIVGYPIFLKKCSLISNGINNDSIFKLDIIVRYCNRDFFGTGSSFDFLNSVIKAMIYVLNDIFRFKEMSFRKEEIKKEK